MDQSSVTTSCTVQRRNGAFCDAPSAPDMPFPIFRRHAIEVFMRVKEHARGRIGNVPGLTDDPDASAALTAKDERERRARSIVYYIAMPTGRIKIGYTADIKQRCQNLRVSTDDILATEPGAKQGENIRHRQFAAVRHGRTEEFDRSPELLAHIARIRAKHGEPIRDHYADIAAARQERRARKTA